MNLQIDFLRTFIAVADTKGFTSAGRQVNQTQSAVSMQIKRLEDEDGKCLFERTGKTVKLTVEGNILINHARKIVREHDDAILALSKPALKGFVRFGSPEQYTAQRAFGSYHCRCGIWSSRLAVFQCRFAQVEATKVRNNRVLYQSPDKSFQ